MKKLWDSYSYAIILVVLSMITSIVLIVQLEEPNSENFIQVTVTEGESLWEIAELYADEHQLTTVQFVDWVEENNGIVGDRIFPGDELVIPVSIQVDSPNIELASSK